MKISIVTISYNNIEDLQKTCNSIDEQSIAPYEHIIIDVYGRKDFLDPKTFNCW